MTTPAAPSSAPITVRDVAKRFGDGTEAVRSLSIDVAAGEFLALIGPSGCGKSTLLRMIAGLDAPTAGTIDRQGDGSRPDRTPVPLEYERPPSHSPAGADRLAYVFQDANLLPWRSVLRNVTLPLELAGVPRGERAARGREALATVGLADAERKRPAELSGGMRMRVSLARALVTRPTLLLLDEPFAALDEIGRQALDAMLRRLWLDTGMTVVFVTHSIAEATFLADRAIVFSRRPARIVVDERIELPRERDDATRTSTAFAEVQRRLFDALRRGEAMKS